MSDIESLTPSSSFPSTRSGDLFDDFHGLLNDQPSSSQTIPSQQAAPLLLDNAGGCSVSRIAALFSMDKATSFPVNGDETHCLVVYSDKNMGAEPSKRARTVVAAFPPVPDEEVRFFVRHMVCKIMEKRSLPDAFGFTVKVASFFVGPDGTVYVMLVGRQPLTFSKWLLVYEGLDAIGMVVAHYTRSVPGKNQPGMVGVATIFEGMTTIEQLLRNRIVFHNEEPTVSVFVRKHDKSPSSSSKRAKKSPSKKPKSEQKKKKVAESAPTPALVVSQAPFLYQELLHASKVFLSDQALSPESLREYFERLRFFLDNLPGTGSIGHFLLSGRPLDMFAQFIHLKSLVLSVLKNHFRIEVTQLTTAEVSMHPMFAHLDPDSKEFMKSIMVIMDKTDFDQSSLPPYSVVDPVSCLFLCAIYILGRSLDRGQYGGPLDEPFLASFASGIAETVTWFSRVGYHLNGFLSTQVRNGVLSWGEAARYMFPVGFTERQIQRHYVAGFEFLGNFVETPVCDRYFSRRARLSIMVCKVREHFDLTYGDVYFIWKAMFESPQFINVVSPHEEAYRLFPATSFTDDPSLHSPGFGDMKEFARRLVVAQQQFSVVAV